MTKQVRDWNKDMELLQKKPKFTIDEVNHIIYNVAPYWLQQYAAEKERADKLQEALEQAQYHLNREQYMTTESVVEDVLSLYPKEGEAK